MSDLFLHTPFERELIADRDRLKAELEKAEAACAVMREALEGWQVYYKSELEKCDSEIRSYEKAKDSHGVNFHQGRRSGIIQHDIGLQPLKDCLSTDCGTTLLARLRELEEALDGEKRTTKYLELKLATKGERSLCETIDNAAARLGTQRTALSAARETFDRLSKLGNEPMVGNSIGNVIALDAVREIDAVLAGRK